MTPSPETADAPRPIADDAVPVAILPSPLLAHIVRSVLEESGIPAMVAGEHAASLLAHWGTAVSVTVLVPRHDYDRAVAAIDDAITSGDAPDRCAACGYDYRGIQDKRICPECGADYVELRRRISIAPPPKAGMSFITRIGVVLGVLVLLAMAAALIGVGVWGWTPARPINLAPSRSVP